MKFLFSEDGFEAINAAFIEKFFIDNDYDNNGNIAGYVKAETARGQFILKTFNSGNTEKNMNDAKDYLTDLIKNLNGGKF